MIILEMTEEQYEIIKTALQKADICMKSKYPSVPAISYWEVMEGVTRYEIGEPSEAD